MTYKHRDRKFEAKLCTLVDRRELDERTLKSAWHLLIAAVGLYELRNHKTRLSKVLACGLIAFHADAALFDWLDKPTTLQRLLRKLRS